LSSSNPSKKLKPSYQGIFPERSMIFSPSRAQMGIQKRGLTLIEARKLTISSFNFWNFSSAKPIKSILLKTTITSFIPRSPKRKL